MNKYKVSNSNGGEKLDSHLSTKCEINVHVNMFKPGRSH